MSIHIMDDNVMTIEDSKVQVCQLNVILAKFPNQAKDNKILKMNM